MTDPTMPRPFDRIRRAKLWPMLRKEFIQMRRDRLTFAMMLGIPIIQMMLFGYAIRTEVRHLPAVVLDESRSSESRALVNTLEQTQNFRIVGNVASREELRGRIESGEASAAIIIPPGFQHDIKRGRTATAQVIVDAADPLASSAAISGAALAATVRAQALISQQAGKRTPPLEVRVRPWYNPALRSAVYIVPGVIGVLLTMTMIMITSMSVVRERERGTLEQLVVTPIDKTSMMLGKLLPFVIVGYIQMSVILMVGKFLFGVPIRGSLPLLYFITLGFITANLSLGLLISTVAKVQVQAMQLSFFMMLPNILLSGFMFPRAAMPEPAQWIGAVLPLTYYLQVLRGIVLKGVGMEHLWTQTVTLFGIAIVLITISVVRFSKTVE